MEGYILLLETDTDYALLTLLQKEGIELRQVHSGEEALKLIEEEKPALLLLDLKISDKDPYDLCTDLKANKTSHHIPIIFTANDEASLNKDKLFEVGGADYLLRPFHHAEVLARIKHQLNLNFLKQELAQLSQRDEVTQIANRQRFDENFLKEWQRAYRNLHPLAIILANIDDFKSYNETYGTETGDYCLKNISNALSKVIQRPADLVARYSDTEIAVILPETGSKGAQVLAETMRSHVEDLEIEHTQSKHDQKVSLSLGVVSIKPWTQEEDAHPKMIEWATKALLSAKDNGKNQVQVYDVI